MIKIGDLVQRKDQPGHSFVIMDLFWESSKWTATLRNRENEEMSLCPCNDLINISDISLKVAFQRIRRELKENPQYLSAWKEKLNNLLYSNRR